MLSAAFFFFCFYTNKCSIINRFYLHTDQPSSTSGHNKSPVKNHKLCIQTLMQVTKSEDDILKYMYIFSTYVLVFAWQMIHMKYQALFSPMNEQTKYLGMPFDQILTCTLSVNFQGNLPFADWLIQWCYQKTRSTQQR